MSGGPLITVIIPTRDRVAILERTLSAYMRQVEEADGEILVIDDGSRDETPELLSKLSGESPRLTWIESERRGPSAARNLGISSARAPLLLFTGDDMIPGEGLLKGHIETQSCCKGEVVLGHVTWDPACNPTWLMRRMAPNGPLFNYRKVLARKGPLCRFFYTANLSIPISDLGGERFNERFVHAAFEDIDLGARLIKRGINFIYQPELVVYHHHHMTAGGLHKRLETMREGRKILEELHPDLAMSPSARLTDFLLRLSLRFLSLFESKP